MKQTITIRDLWVDAIIGIHDFEKAAKQPICLTVQVQVDAANAMQSDAIADTLDYYTLTKHLIAYVKSHPTELLEKLLNELLSEVASFPLAESAHITIDKPKALEEFGAVVSLSGSWQRL